MAFTASAQEWERELDLAYDKIMRAVAATRNQPRFHLNVGGWTRVGEGALTEYRLRMWMQGNQFWADSYVGEDLKLRIVADGSLIWRYDPVANEYTYIRQGDNVIQALGTASAWMRAEMQRPMRLLADSARWLVRPTVGSPPEDLRVRLWETRPVGQGDWRGTDLTFRFEDEDRVRRMKTLAIHERIDSPAGLRETQLTGEFFYFPFEFTFSFQPPQGARPAADLPRRDGG